MTRRPFAVWLEGGWFGQPLLWGRRLRDALLRKLVVGPSAGRSTECGAVMRRIRGSRESRRLRDDEQIRIHLSPFL